MLGADRWGGDSRVLGAEGRSGDVRVLEHRSLGDSTVGMARRQWSGLGTHQAVRRRGWGLGSGAGRARRVSCCPGTLGTLGTSTAQRLGGAGIQQVTPPPAQ